MNRKLFFILFFLTCAAFSARPARAAQQVPAASLLDPQNAEKANAHEDELYASAKSDLDDSDYDDAIKGFDEVIKIHGRKACRFETDRGHLRSLLRKYGALGGDEGEPQGNG